MTSIYTEAEQLGYEFVGKKEDVVKQIGNAVGVRTARALCLSILRNNIWWLRKRVV